MRAYQIMTRQVLTVCPDTTIVDAANTMLKQHISGLPVINAWESWSVSFRKAILFAVPKLERNEGGLDG